MIQLAWRFLMFQKESALALWYRARTADSRSGTRKTQQLRRNSLRPPYRRLSGRPADDHRKSTLSSRCFSPPLKKIPGWKQPEGSLMTRRWRKTDSNPRSRLSRAARSAGSSQSLGRDWRRPGASSYVVASPSGSLIQPARIKHAASCRGRFADGNPTQPCKMLFFRAAQSELPHLGDPRRWLILAHLEHALGRRDLRTRAPPDDEAAGGRRRGGARVPVGKGVVWLPITPRPAPGRGTLRPLSRLVSKKPDGFCLLITMSCRQGSMMMTTLPQPEYAVDLEWGHDRWRRQESSGGSRRSWRPMSPGIPG